MKTLSLSVKLDVPNININQTCIEEAIKLIFSKNPQALVANSPEEVLEKLGLNQQSKWASFIEDLEQHTMGKEAGTAFDQGRQEFKDNFVMKNPVFGNDE